MSLVSCLMTILGPIDDATRRMVLSIAAELRMADPGLATVQCDGLRGHVYSAALEVMSDLMNKARPGQGLVVSSVKGMRVPWKVSHAKWDDQSPPKRCLSAKGKHEYGQNRRRRRMGRLGQTALCATAA